MLRTASLLAMLATLICPAAAGESVADFYKDKTVTISIGFPPGGEYDLHARIVSRFIDKHIPGNPTVIASTMTGAGGLVVTNHLYSVAQKDGTQLGVIANGAATAQAVGAPGVQFDAREFHWIGALGPTIETMAVWHTVGVRTLEEATRTEIVAGASGRGATSYIMPLVMNELFSTKFKIVTGYRGGADMNVAMERGEIGARNNSWTSWKSTKPDWLRENKFHTIAYAGPATLELANVAHLNRIAKTEDDRRIVEMVFSGSRLGRPFVATPGIPAARVQALRAAFDATMKDPEFVAAAKQAKIELAPLRGVDMQKVVSDVLATPPALAARAKQLLQ